MSITTNSDEQSDPKPQPASSAQAIEQYKAKLSDLGNVGSRQTTMTAYYISIISALFGILAFKEKAFSQIDTVVLLMVSGAGFLVCVLWFYSLSFFRVLFRTKLKVLEEMEESFPFQTFQNEFKQMRESGIRGWIWIERLVPVVFAVFFLVVIIVRIAQVLCTKS
jgi:hypothetical protein